MKKVVFKSYNTLLSVLMSFLGFTAACDKNGGNSPVEYGMPHADFVIKGTITSSLNQSPVSKLRVIMKSVNFYRNDTVSTDNTGKYEVAVQDFGDDQTFHLVVDDIDGDANGLYQAKDSVVEFKRTELTGGDGHWYDGKAEKNINIVVKPQDK